MRFLPEGAPQRRKPPAPPIPGLKNGVEIFPVPGEDDIHWAEAVSTHYPDFVPYSLSHAIAVAVRQWVVVPIVLFLLVFLLRSGPGVEELVDFLVSPELLAVGENGEGLAAALEEVKLRSRQYAKRQLTWLRRNQEIHWIVWEKERDFGKALQISTEILTAAGYANLGRTKHIQRPTQ